MVTKSCDGCGEQMSLGDIAVPKSKDWIKVVCSNCGHSMDISMLRLHQLQVKVKN